MNIYDWPSQVLSATVAVYWSCVVIKSIRLRRQSVSLKSVWIPASRRERLMMMIWVPTIGAWIHMPFKAATQVAGSHPMTDLPAFATQSLLVYAIRWCVVATAVEFLLLSIWCWRYMGNLWRMAVDDGTSKLLVGGPFALVRHPIYALSSGLMLCSVIIVPTPAMMLAAAVHLTLLNIKVRNEERFLLERFGDSYRAYCRRVGRFIPRNPFRKRNDPLSHSSGVVRTTGSHPEQDLALHPLSDIQHGMLMWEEVLPYNAVHALRIDRPADEQKLRRALESVLPQLGVGDLIVDRAAEGFAWDRPSSPQIESISEDQDLPASIERRLTDGLNLSFNGASASPFRWSIVGGGSGHWIVLAYRHVACDGGRIAKLLAAVTNEYLGTTQAPAGRPPIEAGDGTPQTAERPDFLRGFIHSTRVAQRIKRAFVLPVTPEKDWLVHVVTSDACAGLLPALAKRCKAQGFSVTDAFLAALASAMGTTEAYRGRPARERRLALGSVRGNGGGPPSQNEFFAPIGLHSVVVTVDDPSARLSAVIQEVASQTGWHRRHLQAAIGAAAIRTRWGRQVWPILGIPNTVPSYRRYFPVCAGVSPMRIDDGTFGPAEGAISRYVRSVPTGPATAVALAPTTYRGRMELSLTAMNACLDRNQSSTLLAAVVDRLTEFAGER